MTKWIEKTGRSEEDAISAALFQLGLDRDDVSVEVLERAKSGFLGFGASPARVRVSYEVADDDTVIKADSKLDEILAAPKEEAAAPAAPKEKKPVAPAAPVTPAAPVVKSEPVRPAVKVEEPKKEAVVEEEEETILVAKSEWKPAAPKKAPREPRPRSTKKQQPARSENRLQEGDEVIIGKQTERVPFSQAVTTPVDANDEKAQKIAEFLRGLMEHMDVDAIPEIGITDEGNYKVQLQGKGLGAIIGRRGETLDAIQQLTNYAVNRGQSKRVRVHIDAEGYRAKREESLQHLAMKVAGKVVKYRKDMKLEPMNAYERHVIHAALQDVPKVSTYSTGVEPNRRTVIAYTPNK